MFNRTNKVLFFNKYLNSAVGLGLHQSATDYNLVIEMLHKNTNCYITQVGFL